MMGKWLRTISSVSAVTIALWLGSAQLVAQEINLTYRCVILKTQSTLNLTTTLPANETQLSVGDAFYVEFWATDSRTTNVELVGLVAVYADLDYSQNLVGGCMPSVTSLFNVFPSGTCNGLIVDELGGSQFASGVGAVPAWARIASVEFTADVTGVANFVLNPAQFESSTFGLGLVLPANIDYGSCSVPIGNVVTETGACCDVSNTCTENLTQNDCLMLNGRYLGNRVACADDPDADTLIGCSDICPTSPAPAGVNAQGRPLGDVDDDCDVDLEDYWIIQGNFSGPSR